MSENLRDAVKMYTFCFAISIRIVMERARANNRSLSTSLTATMLIDAIVHHSRARFLEEKRAFERYIDSLPNPPLDSLLDLYHASDIQFTKCPSERYIHGIDLLNALACYNDIVILHYYCGQSQKAGMHPFITLLDDGVDVNVCNERGSTAFECFARCERRNNCINEIVRYLFKQTHKLKVVGLHVHPQNSKQYELVKSRNDMRMFVDQQLAVDYDEELRRMDQCKVKDSTMTLRDVLRDEVELTEDVMVGLGKMVRDKTYEASYPRLWCLVKMRYRQVITREVWRPLVTDALRMVTRCKLLSQDCVDMIVKELRNYDLGNLLAVAFNECLRRYREERKTRKNSARLSTYWSPRKMMPRI